MFSLFFTSVNVTFFNLNIQVYLLQTRTNSSYILLGRSCTDNIPTNGVCAFICFGF